MKKKVMISQKMRDLPDSVIKENREKLIKYTKEEIFKGEDIEIVDSYCEEYPDVSIKGANKAVWYLGKSITKMAEADALVVEAGAEDARGCGIEIEVANRYGIKVYPVAKI